MPSKSSSKMTNPKSLSQKKTTEKKKIESNSKKSSSELFQIFLIVTLYFGSSTCFHVIHNEWSVAQAFYYSVQSGLSIGFGVLAETDDVSRFYTVIHVILGAIMISVSFSLIFARVLERIEAQKINAAKDSTQKKQSLIAIFVDACFSTEVVIAMLWISLGIGIGVVLEGWSVIHSLYFALTGISTAGLEGPSNVDVSKLFSIPL